MIDNATTKADDGLNAVNDWLKRTTDKIGPNFVLFVALLNGVFIGLVTTGFLGDASTPVKSMTFVLIIWQFVLTCILTARYVDYSVSYLIKFMLSSMTGYHWQWQLFAMIWPSETFQPPFGDHGIMYIAMSSILILSHCFSGNVRSIKLANKYELPRNKHVA